MRNDSLVTCRCCPCLRRLSQESQRNKVFYDFLAHHLRNSACGLLTIYVIIIYLFFIPYIYFYLLALVAQD